MPDGRIETTEGQRLRGVLFVALLTLLFITPLPFGSVQPSWVLVIEGTVATLAMLALTFDRSTARSALTQSRSFMIGIAGFALLTVLQIIPFPWLSFALSPEVARHAREQLTRIEPSAVAALFPQSISPPNSLDAALRLIAYGLAIWTAAAVINDRASRVRLSRLLVALGAFEAIYGTAEYLSGHQHIFGYAKKYYLEEATGTFINRNHFGGFLAMTLPFALAFTLPSDRWSAAERSWRDRVTDMARGRNLNFVFGSIAAVCIWAGLLLSYSRGALLAAMSSTVLFAICSLRRKRAALRIAATAVLPAFLLLWVAVRAPGERFVALPTEIESHGNRLMVAKTTFGIIEESPVLGWGLGTFESAFRLRKPLADRFRFDHAHDEPLQLTAEAGLLGAVAFFLILVGCTRRIFSPRSPAETQDHTVHAIAASLTGLTVHCFLDFPLRIPAIALLASVLVGVAFAATHARRQLAADNEGPILFANPRRAGASAPHDSNLGRRSTANRVASEAPTC